MNLRNRVNRLQVAAEADYWAEEWAAYVDRVEANLAHMGIDEDVVDALFAAVEDDEMGDAAEEALHKLVEELFPDPEAVETYLATFELPESYASGLWPDALPAPPAVPADVVAALQQRRRGPSPEREAATALLYYITFMLATPQ